MLVTLVGFAAPAMSEGPNELEQKYPDTFPVCVTTRSISKKPLAKSVDTDVTLAHTFLAKDGHLGLDEKFPSHEELKSEHKKDDALASLFETAVSEDATRNVSCGYFVSDGGVLMRKWTSPDMTSEDGWDSVYQVVVPSAYRSNMMHLAHDHRLAGQMGVIKSHKL